MMFARRALAVVALGILAACASVPMAAPERDFAAKEFAKPSRGKAALYVFRNEAIGGSVKMSLQLDGTPLGETGPKTFHWVTIKPGKHTLVGKAENESVVEFTAASGQNVFVWRSEEHTSELQSPCNLVCRLLLEKKKQSSIHPICRPPLTK